MTALILRRALIEDGLVSHSGLQISNTRLADIHVSAGRITSIVDVEQVVTDSQSEVIDLDGMLVTPSYREIHCHLDKTLLGEPWRPLPRRTSLLQQFERERTELPKMRTPLRERAEALLNVYLAQGVTHLRTHVDVFPEIGLSHVETVLELLSQYREFITAEVVVFPQHGLIRSGAGNLVTEALKLGATHVGGVDPAIVDGSIEVSLRETVQLAADYGAGIDLHLHDADMLGLFTIERLLNLASGAKVQDVSISHAFCLGQVPQAALDRVTNQLCETKSTIISSVPLNTSMPPLRWLQERGVNVAVGCDNIYDLWSPFGNGDLLERLSRLAEYERWSEEKELVQALSLITPAKPQFTPGASTWLRVGDEANLVATPAASSAELVARRIPPQWVIYQGRPRALAERTNTAFSPFTPTPVIRG